MAGGATLIVVHGVPGAGKTTLVRRLKKDLAVPAAGKDDIKEQLYETLGTRDLEWKMLLGRASMEMLYVLAEEMLTSGHTFIIEAPFFREIANQRLQGVIGRTGARALQIYCQVPMETAKKRFIHRVESGERNPKHRDRIHYAMIEDPEYWEKYGPLDIAPPITLQTETHNEDAYNDLLRQLRTQLKEENI